MKILLLITGLGIGGAEKQVCDLADKFTSLGHKVKLISLSPPFFEQTLPKEKVDILFLNMRKNPLSLFTVYIKLREIIKEFEPDVIHSHMFHANLIARLVRLSIKFNKLICSAHSNNEGGRLRMFAYRLTNFLSDLNTNVSKDAVDTFIIKQAVRKDQMIAMENGIDTSFFSKNDIVNTEMRSSFPFLKDSYVFLAVGRLTDPKDYPYLIKSFSIVYSKNTNVNLLIAGIGELEQELKRYTEELKMTDHVHFLGLRRDINRLMNIADTYVMSSHFEGLPLVIGEAMATEKVVVSTDCGGTREILGGNGFLVPIKDSEALANEMLKSMTLSQEERSELGKKARQHIVENYSLDAVVNKWLTLYQEKK